MCVVILVDKGRVGEQLCFSNEESLKKFIVFIRLHVQSIDFWSAQSYRIMHYRVAMIMEYPYQQTPLDPLIIEQMMAEVNANPKQEQQVIASTKMENSGIVFELNLPNWEALYEEFGFKFFQSFF